MSASDAVTLTNPEDWERWLKQLRAFTDEDIWGHIDPDDSDLEEEPLQKPTKPQVKDFNINADTYAQLSETHRKAYDNSRKYYESDLKQYQRQQDLHRAVRTYITTHVSEQKELLLEPSDSTYQWLVRLKDDTKPSDQFMRSKVEHQYTEALKGLKPTKINQWLDRWEHAMKLAEKHELPHIRNGRWLQDLARAIRPLSETYGILYTKQARDPQRSKSSEFHKVAMELREEFAELTKKSASSTMRGSAFNADFAGEPEEGNPATEGQQGGGNDLSNNRKRAGTNSVEKEANAPKKSKKSKCPACELKGHTLSNCWYLFDYKRPEGFKVSSVRMEKTRKRIEQDKDLAAQVEKLRSGKEEDDDEA
jgi:hypothetical protein